MAASVVSFLRLRFSFSAKRSAQVVSVRGLVMRFFVALLMKGSLARWLRRFWQSLMRSL